MRPKSLRIANAAENNLKNLSLEIPHDKLVVLTGISGSGKSSLAFDTVYAEGQRRYIETFSPYTRQFFDKVKRPKVDLIENVRPAIAIQQRTRITGSRSTVGSITDINDYLKIVWSNLAKPNCPVCGENIKNYSPQSLTHHLAQLFAMKTQTLGESTIYIAVSIGAKTTKEAHAVSEKLIALGFSRVFDPLESKVVDLDSDVKSLKLGELLVVIERFKSGSFDKRRLTQAIETAFSLSSSFSNDREAACVVIEPNNRVRSLLSVSNSPGSINIKTPRYHRTEYYAQALCRNEQIKIQKARPALFSFNHPYGACPECKGFGRVLTIDSKLVIPDTRLSIKEKALQCWAGPGASGQFRKCLQFAKKNNISVSKPWRELASEEQDLIFNHRSREFKGVNAWFKRLERKAYKMHVRVFLAKYRAQTLCPNCNGARLKPSALAYRIGGKNLSDIWSMPISALREWISSLHLDLKRESSVKKDVDDVLKAIIGRLDYLISLGLPYITLDRQSRTLSGGETQRVNLAGALGSELVSTHFVLDEPSVGLHARDTLQLMDALTGLKAHSNSVLLVEHDLECIDQGEHIIELGPKAGANGGEIVFEGARENWGGIKVSTTPSNGKVNADNGPALLIKDAAVRNLKNITVKIPLKALTCLTGVSGSGKSTLVTEVLLQQFKNFELGLPANNVIGFENVEQLLLVDQTPVAKSPRANIATYSGMWDEIRKLLASCDDGLAFSPSAFSFNVDGGRCPACKGAGLIREDMQFLSDVYIPCELCLGKRFQPAILGVKYRGRSVDQILQMTVDEACRFFHTNITLEQTASILSNLGLGHLALGSPLSELSGGEAQRLKLVPFISQSHKRPSLLIFDEPTTGLHQYDVEGLIALFKSLRDKGHSIICVEHNLSLISCADWIIDLGPEGGDTGGHIVKTGTPKQFIEQPGDSYTGKFLKLFHERHAKGDSKGVAHPKKIKELSASTPPRLKIKGAREHNLKNIDIELPLGEMVAITGVSGSGKSSIAKDIIYAEGQRRYLDCLSPYARQFVHELKKPEIDSIINVPPTICVYQHTFQPSGRSTVGTMSEAYNFMRLLFAKIGVQYCPDHPEAAISPLSPREIATAIKELPDRTVRLLATIVKSKKGNHRAILERAIASEITQIRVDGIFLNPSTLSVSGGLERSKPHTIEFVTSKINPATVDLELIEEAVSHALSLGSGTLIVHTDTQEKVFSLERACPVCQRGFFKPDPEDLSFGSKRGACKRCDGSGRDARGAACERCFGTRLQEVGRSIKLGGKNIHELSLLIPDEIKKFLSGLNLTSRERIIAQPVLGELYAKLDTLGTIGLDYIALDRDCATLSGGELQRLRLATAMGSPLSGVMYIFDEPSIGLHPLDNFKVLKEIRSVCRNNNSVLMIEHDVQSILSADSIIDVGPGGGAQGGEIVFAGAVSEFIGNTDSKTALALAKPPTIERGESSNGTSQQQLKLNQVSANNIKQLDLKIPLKKLVTVCGVSGAGKSTLVHSIILNTVQHGKATKRGWQLGSNKIESSVPIEKICEVDQKPIGINPRSTPASYLGVWDEIRKLFASTNEAKARGFSAGAFSYNTGKLRCSECRGLGRIKLEMSFLPEARIECEVCGGKRFNDDAQLIRYLGLTISESLALTFDEARRIFVNHRKIHEPLQAACELGLGYLTLGQESATLSGGESQRVKLVSELGLKRQEHTLYILDEPTTGLHRSDVAKLVKCLRALTSKGHSVIVIEHDLDIICSSDYLIELGPGPAERGGKVIFEGASERLLRADTPWGGFLRAQLEEFKGNHQPAMSV